MTDTVWKVLRQGAGSTWISTMEINPYQVIYLEGAWIEPSLPGSRLLVFREASIARDFLDVMVRCTQATHALWETEGENPVRIPALPVMPDTFAAFWAGRDIPLGGYLSAPAGTYGVTRLRLTRLLLEKTNE